MNNGLVLALQVFSKEVQAQYAPFGYGNNYSDSGSSGDTGGVGGGPLGGNLDLDMSARKWEWKEYGNEFVKSRGTDKGNKPSGSNELLVRKKCSDCKGKVGQKCNECHGRGFILYEYFQTKTEPKVDGTIMQQWQRRRFNNTRDWQRLPSEDPTSWDEYSRKPMLTNYN